MKQDWPTKRLADVCQILGGATPSKKNPKFYGGDIPWATVGDMNVEVITTTEEYITKAAVADCSTNIIPSGSIVMATRVGLGKVCVLGQDTAINQDLKGLTPKNHKELTNRWLYWWLKSMASEIQKAGTGATVQGVKMTFVQELEIPLPPLAEQKRIVALLDEAFAGIDEAKAKAEANISEAESLLRSHLNLTFRIPKRDWIETKLGTIGRVSMCKRILKEQTKQTGEIPFYKIGTFGKQPDAYIPSSIYNDFRSKYPFPSKGEILISAAGTIGRRVRYDGEPAYFQDSNIVWIENDEKKVLNNYLYHFYSACEWNSTSGATISRLYNDNLRSIDIVFPASLSEQQEIAVKTDSVVSEVKKLGEAYQQKDAAYSFLKASILSQAFAGELTA